MRILRFAVLPAAAALLLTGCGDETDAGGAPSGGPSSPTTGTPLPSTPPSSSTTPGTSPGTTGPETGLPLTVTRTGGFAGFDDRVVVGPDGVASVSRRGEEPIRCRLDPALLAGLTAAVRQIDWAAVGSTKPTVRHPDDMIIAVAAGGGLTRLEDPKVRPLAAPVSQLLTQATIPPGDRCRPV